jgi:eukaryotic-like serine/threonine-protein kinase
VRFGDVVLRAGTMISGYRIEKVLGSGGMGTVYLAANPVLPRRDALKVLSSELSQDPGFRTRFLREADLAATLDQPNVATVYTRGETEEGQLWIAMQLGGRQRRPQGARPGRDDRQADSAYRQRGRQGAGLRPPTQADPSRRQTGRTSYWHPMTSGYSSPTSASRALDDSVGLTATGNVMASVAYAAPETLAGFAQPKAPALLEDPNPPLSLMRVV